MAAGRPWAALPADLAELLRPDLRGVVEEVIAAVRAEVPEYDQPLEGEFGRLISQGVSVALDGFVSLLGHDADVPDLETSEALGRAEHRAGRTLDALQSAYRVGARVAWRRVAQVGVRERVAPETMYLLAEAIFAYIDRLAGASVAGFTRADALRAGALQARRHALVELLAAPLPPDPVEADRVAEQAGWAPPPRELAALVAEGADPAGLARRLPSGAIGAAIDPVGVVLVPDPDGPGRSAQTRTALGSRRAVLGPTVPWREAHRSVERVIAAWPLHAAGRLGDAPVVRTEDHLVALLLAAAPRVTADLVAGRLAPLSAMSEGARERAEATLRAWLCAHGDVSAAAEALHVHPQTVRYRLAGLREDFALDDPKARLELALALQAASSAGSATGAAEGASSAAAGPPTGSA